MVKSETRRDAETHVLKCEPETSRRFVQFEAETGSSENMSLRRAEPKIRA